MIMLRREDGRPYASISGGSLVLREDGPDYLRARGRLDLPKTADLVTLPAGLRVRRLDLSHCTRLARIPEGLTVRHLDLTGCTGITSLPDGLRCYELSLGGTRLRSLPADLRVEFRLDLRDCTELAGLPAGLKVGTLILRGCTGLEALPEGLDVNFLDLQGCHRLAHWPDGANVRIGRLNLGGCGRLAALPATLGRLSWLDISGCTRLTALPEGLRVGSGIEIAGSGLAALPRSLAGVQLRWNGVAIDERIAFRPETIGVDEILAEENAERRRVLLERYGLERFMLDADAEVLDADRDAGGERRLLRVPLEGDEDLVGVLVQCPSTGGRYLLRVPPTMTTCRQAVAWTAGFDDPGQYRPLVET
jgi:hypothetical protein